MIPDDAMDLRDLESTYAAFYAMWLARLAGECERTAVLGELEMFATSVSCFHGQARACTGRAA